MDSVADDDLRALSERELDKMTGTSATTRWRERKAGRWPPLIEISPGRKANTLGQIRKMMAARVAEAEARQAEQQQEPRGRGRPRKEAEAAIPAE